MFGGFGLFTALMLALGSASSCILSAYLLSKVFPFNRNLSSLVDIASLILVSTILGLSSGLIDATIIYQSGRAEPGQFQSVFYTWFIGDFFWCCILYSRSAGVEKISKGLAKDAEVI